MGIKTKSLLAVTYCQINQLMALIWTKIYYKGNRIISEITPMYIRGSYKCVWAVL